MPRWKLLLAVALPVVLLCCGGGVALATWGWGRLTVDTTGRVAFVNRLAVPPLAASRIDERGRRVFELRADEGKHDFGGRTADTWGFNGAYLGPTLRAARGEQVVVNVRNDLANATTVHWHGMHLPAAMDGGPHQIVRPGTTWAPTWRITQPAATLWYHPHAHGSTADHVYRGLAGMFLLDDEQSGRLTLPRDYGVDDVPVIVQDRSTGGFRPQLTDIGRLGDEIIVNGVRSPYLDVPTEAVRLRLLNASVARTYRFTFADARAFDVIGTDGGLLERPVAVTFV